MWHHKKDTFGRIPLWSCPFHWWTLGFDRNWHSQRCQNEVLNLIWCQWNTSLSQGLANGTDGWAAWEVCKRQATEAQFGSYSPKYVWSTTSWDSVQLCGQNYRGITNTGSCQLIKWKNDRKEVGADLLTALHVMLQPGCRSWKRQLLSPSPAHSNHQGHPKKPFECNSHVFMCDPQTDGSTSACLRNPTSVCSNGKQHSPAHLILPNLSLLPCLPQKTCKKPEPKHGTNRAIQLQWGPNAYNFSTEQLHLAFAKTKFNWFHLL